jgi:hypothetical protein
MGGDVGIVLRILLLSVIAATSLFSSLSLSCAHPSESEPQGQYLSLPDGSKSSIFLVESELEYGSYEQDVYHLKKDAPKKGDPAAIIRGTVRSDYQEDFYIGLSADVYDSEGQKLGVVVSPSAPLEGFAVLFVHSGNITPFRLHVPYEGTDVASYHVFLGVAPSDFPPP